MFHAPGDRAEGESAEETAPLTVLINPEIEIMSEHMEDGWEGCLSVPGLRGSVPRYIQLRYSGVDLDGKLIEREATGFHARGRPARVRSFGRYSISPADDGSFEADFLIASGAIGFSRADATDEEDDGSEA